jgi:HEAT repeat protein
LIRQRIAEALGNLNTAKSVSALKFLAKDIHPQVSEAARISLERLEQK